MIPAIVQAIGAILSAREGKKNNQNSLAMASPRYGTIGGSFGHAAPGAGGSYNPVGQPQVSGTIGENIQPGQMRMYNPAAGGYQNGGAAAGSAGGASAAGSAGSGGFQKFASNAGLIAGLLNSFRGGGSGSNSAPYQMKLRRG